MKKRQREVMPKTSLFYAYFVLVRKYKNGKCLVHTVTKPFIDRHFLSIKIQLDSIWAETKKKMFLSMLW